MALSEYDVKGEATVKFKVGSAKISPEDEEKLKQGIHRRGDGLCPLEPSMFCWAQLHCDARHPQHTSSSPPDVIAATAVRNESY